MAAKMPIGWSDGRTTSRQIKYTQNAGKLILSLDRYLTMEETVCGGSIQFRVEFQNFKLSIDRKTLIDLSAGIQRDTPLVDITLGSGVDSSISNKMEVDVTPSTTVPSAREDKSQKLIDEGSSQYEIGSSSRTLVTSKNKIKNYLRRVRKKNVKVRMIDELEALKQVKFEVKREFIALSIYPLLGENHFHPLPVAQRREVVRRVAQSSIRLLDYYTKRINQAKTQQSPGIDHRPQIEGYDPSTLLENSPSLELVVQDQITIEQSARLRLKELEGLKHNQFKLNKAITNNNIKDYLYLPRLLDVWKVDDRRADIHRQPSTMSCVDQPPYPSSFRYSSRQQNGLGHCLPSDL
ncbi:hypothetical protein M5K25_018792 [Dendrobium thyrsiflorum]|uniref:Uncharacterized protein n=1 Tax=Dendrobium thyrsiflorum TaxID=117978 RepID=A0ABD0UDR6_DENTH